MGAAEFELLLTSVLWGNMSEERPVSLMAEVALAVHSNAFSVTQVAESYSVSEAEANTWHAELLTNAQKLFLRSGKAIKLDRLAAVIAETSTQAIAILNADDICVYANQPFVNLFGYSREELAGATLHSLIHHHTDDGKPYPEDSCPLVEASKNRTVVHRLRGVFFKKDGSQVQVVCSATPSTTEQGESLIVLETKDVTERLELERTSKLNRKRLEKLFSADLIGVVYWNLDGEIEDANAEFLRMVKYTELDLANRRINWRKMTPPEFVKDDDEAVKLLLSVGSHPAMEKQCICKDGSRVWVAVSSAMVDQPHGVAFVQDISLRKYAEMALRVAEQTAKKEAIRSAEANARLSALLEAAPVAIAMCDQRGELVVMNRWNKLLWGENSPFSDSVAECGEWKGWWADGSNKHGRAIKIDEWAMARALRGEEAPRDRIEIQPFDAPDTRKTVLNCGAPIRDAAGNIVGAVIAQMDITDQVRAENALRESEKKFRTIADTMPQMVFSSLPDGYNDYLNKHFYDFTGEPEGALEGLTWQRVIHPDDAPDALAKWEHCLRTREPYEVKYRVRHRSGEYRWALGRALPVLDDHGEIIRWLGTCTDIHDQIKTQEELEETDKNKDNFIALLAHELRNPLAPLRTALDLLKLKKFSDIHLVKSIEIMDRQTKQMSGLIDDLLDVARITRGKVALKVEPVNLQELLRNVCADHRDGLNSKGVDLSLHASESLWLEGDSIRLTQVFGNLLSNACKFSDPGTHVSVTAKRDSDNEKNFAHVSVKDSGKGISDELLKVLFKPFRQAEERSTQLNAGLGLGLAIVEGFVELHGGSVTAHSDGLGKGSIFTVKLPLSASITSMPSTKIT